MILYEYLKQNNPNKSKNNIKSLLKNELVLVNNKVTTKYNYEIKENDVVKITSRVNNDIKVEYEDKYLIIVLKPHNLLTISSEKEKEKTLYHLVSRYLKSKNKKSKTFIVHRLDYETSGLVIFAKDEKVQKLLQNNWDKVIRNYIGLVKGKVNNEGIIKLKLKEHGLNIYIDKDGKDSITEYKLLKTNNYNSLVKINIKTGRKNQIRISFKSIGNPIIGDSKYGIKEKIMYLLANELIFIHPITHNKIHVKLDIPNYFIKRFEHE